MSFDFWINICKSTYSTRNSTGWNLFNCIFIFICSLFIDLRFSPIEASLISQVRGKLLRSFRPRYFLWILSACRAVNVLSRGVLKPLSSSNFAMLLYIHPQFLLSAMISAILIWYCEYACVAKEAVSPWRQKFRENFAVFRSSGSEIIGKYKSKKLKTVLFDGHTFC